MEVWGIDLGGTKIEGVVVTSLDPLQTACRIRVLTDAHLGYRHILDQVGRLLVQMETQTGLSRPARIGIGTPGILDPATKLLKNSNTICLNGRLLKHDLEEALEIETEMANDANCFALAEATLGAARRAPIAFCVIMGTGVGGGIVVDGKVLDGAHGIAGEWGHTVLDPNGEPCYCGKRGCIETAISGPAIERDFERLAGRTLSLPQIVELSRAGDPDALATIERLCERLGRALSQVVNILDPHTVVLGGGVGQIDELYSLGLKHLADNIFGGGSPPTVVKPELGNSAGVFGAALLASP